MSKGLGASYVSRMRRYHLSFKTKNPHERISIICDRAFYHDGAFKYKLPRFYRDRLYRKKFPCEAQIWNKKRKAYETKTVYRYKSKNPLSIQMQVEVRSRVLAEYDRRVAEFKSGRPDLSDSEVHLELCRSEASAKMARQKDIYSKMSRFYNYNRHKNKQL